MRLSSLRAQVPGAQRRWHAWSTRLWILAIILLTLTIYSFGAMIHDRARRRGAAKMLAAIAAKEAATATHDRLLLLGLSPDAVRGLGVDSARALAARVVPAVIASRYALAPLDSAVTVTSNNGVIYGARHPVDRVHGTHTDSSTMWRFDIDVALEAMPNALLMPINMIGVLHNMLLLVSTAVIAGLAVGSSRHVAALADARANFIAGVSHDLRMPLAQILLAGETLELREDLAVPARTRMARSIVRESKRLIGLVENLLLFTRTGAAGITPRVDRVNISALVAETVESVELAATDAGSTIVVNVGTELAIVGDHSLLRQALANLLDNAIKYGPAGQSIAVGASATASVIRITIDDCGPGVPPGERERVFDAYERLLRDEPSHRTGAGLGLAIVRYIVDASGGRVWLDDAPAGGTRAIVELPRATTVA